MEGDGTVQEIYGTVNSADAISSPAVRDVCFRYRPTALGFGYVFAFGDGGAGNGCTALLRSIGSQGGFYSVLGQRDFSGGEVRYVKLELTSTGIPVVAFSKARPTAQRCPLGLHI